MTVVHEEGAYSITTDPPHTRTLKVLFSPVLQKEVEGFAAGYTILPAGESSDYARHLEGEMFCVLSGTGEVKGENSTWPIKPGSMVWCAPWEFHQLLNSGEETLKVLWLLIPPGREEDLLRKSHRKARDT